MLLAGEETQVFGRQLIINPVDLPTVTHEWSVDVETDEKDNFVGIGLYNGGPAVYYFTNLDWSLQAYLSTIKIIAHNMKFDARMLQKWGINVKSENFYFDTMLASYSVDGGAETHALKPLAQKHLGYKWPTYDEMTKERTTTEMIKRFKMEKGEDGKRHRIKLDEPEVTYKEKVTKHTLDTQPVEKVAHYCASDVVATWDLMRYFERTMNAETRWIFSHLEMPTLRIVFDMEKRGIRIDVDRLRALNLGFQGEMLDLEGKIKETLGVDININSSKQLAPHLERLGMELPVTEKGNKKTSKDVLARHKGHPLADLLLEYSQVKKLFTAFTKPMLDLPTLPRINPTFNQVVRESERDEQNWGGIATGRLSCSNPNLQQIPRRSKRGKMLRELFVPEVGAALICADFSQIEPRILAHMSKDPYLIDVYRTDKDVYTSLVAGTSVASREDARDYGKVGYLALTYMAQPKKLAEAWKCSLEEAQEIYEGMWKNLPRVRSWQNACIAYGTQLGGVKTLFKRYRSLPNLKSRNWKERAAAERRAVNTPIQGSAADIMKLAMIKLTEAGYKLNLIIHDEVLISVPTNEAEMHCGRIKDIMESVTQLLVPIKVDANIGVSWGVAKG